MRTIEQRWEKPEYEVLCVLGYENGVQQIARLTVGNAGRCMWKTRRAAEKHAREYTVAHGQEAYVSEV